MPYGWICSHTKKWLNLKSWKQRQWATDTGSSAFSWFLVCPWLSRIVQLSFLTTDLCIFSNLGLHPPSVAFFPCFHNGLRPYPYNKSPFSILTVVQLLSSNCGTSILSFYLINNVKMSYHNWDYRVAQLNTPTRVTKITSSHNFHAQQWRGQHLKPTIMQSDNWIEKKRVW